MFNVFYLPKPSVNHNGYEVQTFFLGKMFCNKVESEKTANHEKCFQKYGAFKVAKPNIVDDLKRKKTDFDSIKWTSLI